MPDEYSTALQSMHPFLYFIATRLSSFLIRGPVEYKIVFPVGTLLVAAFGGVNGYEWS